MNENWSRIKESYDGGFTEMYLDLYKIESEFVLKGTSFHYNAGAEKVLCEIWVPNSLRNAKDILKFAIRYNNEIKNETTSGDFYICNELGGIKSWSNDDYYNLVIFVDVEINDSNIKDLVDQLPTFQNTVIELQ